METVERLAFVSCSNCGNEQADMGHNVACEECGETMPTNDPGPAKSTEGQASEEDARAAALANAVVGAVKEAGAKPPKSRSSKAKSSKRRRGKK